MRSRRAALPARSRQILRLALPTLGWLVFSMCGAVLGITQPASGGVSGFGGSTTYTGQLGPVSAARTICVCVSTDSNLSNLIGCLEIRTNGGTYFAPTLNTNTYFAVGFLDLNANIGLDAGEPYVIYNGKSAPPGDPIVAGLTQNAINFSFGDENIWPPAESAPTPSATGTQTPTSTPPPSPTATPSPTSTLQRHCPGDCDGDGDVMVGEIIALVNIALGNAQLSLCMSGDTDGSHDVTIDEIVAAVDAALSGCT
jgi:hypothetical protein